MAVADTVKICLLGLRSERAKALDILYNFGRLQIKEIEDKACNASDELSGLDYNLAQLKFAIDFIEKHAPVERVSFREKLVKIANRGWQIKHGEIERLAENYDFKNIISRSEELESRLNNSRSKIDVLQKEITELEPWSDLSYNHQEIISDRISVIIGTISREGLADLGNNISSNKLPLEIIRINEKETELRLSLIYLNSSDKNIKTILAKHGFCETILPSLQASPGQEIKNRKRQINELLQMISGLEKESAGLSKEVKNLQIIFDYLTWQRDKTEAAMKTLAQGKTFYLVGYIEKSQIAHLEKLLQKKTANYHLQELAPDEGEEMPVALKNNRVVYPFEVVTNIYGAPKSNELDPTPFLAPFFILFFGICLSDAGYGLLLGGLSFLAIKLFKLPPSRQGFFRLMTYAGIVTFFIGALFGGWFGIVLEDLPDGVIKSALLFVKIIDPATNPLTMLVFSLILGVIQVITGITINLYYRIKQKDWGKVFDSGSWLFVMLGIVFWLIASQVFKNTGLQQIGQYWIYAGIAILVLTQGRRQKNIFMKLPVGILSLYSVVGYFSDVMSYSRLLALGLATGIIGFVVNIVAMLFKDMIPFLGWPIAIGILIGGHVFNLAINTLGSFIHSGRLQYVEFFPKFMEGGGTRFKPFVKQAKYINLEQSEINN